MAERLRRASPSASSNTRRLTPGRHARIYAVVARIPLGRVATYGQVARLANLPGQARLVGYALTFGRRHSLRERRPREFKPELAAGFSSAFASSGRK